MTARLERALADLLGSYDGGYTFWRAACVALDEALDEARDHDHFRAHPPGAFRDLLRRVDDALRMAATAVEVQMLLDDEPDDKDAERRRDIAELLHARAAALATERNPLRPVN